MTPVNTIRDAKHFVGKIAKAAEAKGCACVATFHRSGDEKTLTLKCGFPTGKTLVGYGEHFQDMDFVHRGGIDPFGWGMQCGSEITPIGKAVDDALRAIAEWEFEPCEQEDCDYCQTAQE